MFPRIMIALIYFYQKCVSPLAPPCCRFYPSCSDYAMDAIRIHGSLKGSFLAVKRLFRCHPYNPGGYDPVPVTGKSREDIKS